MALAFKVSSIAVSGSPGTEVIAAQLRGYEAARLYVKNEGANPLTACVVKLGADLVDMDDYDATTFATLAPGATKSLLIPAPIAGFAVQATAASGTDVTAWLDEMSGA